MAWQSFISVFLCYSLSLRVDAEAIPPTQIEPISSPPQDFPKETGKPNKRKRARRPVVQRDHCRLPVNLRELYLSMRKSGLNSRTRKAAKSMLHLRRQYKNKHTVEHRYFD